MKKTLLAISCLFALQACGDASQVNTLTFAVKTADFNIIIPAKGELKAAAKKMVSAPRSNRGTLILSWLVEENSMVKKGDVVAKFDGEQHLLKRKTANLELEKNQLTRANTQSTLAISQSSIESQSVVVAQEMAMSQRFSIDDISVYSKNEIIDQLLNSEFLIAKEQYLDWSKGSKMAQGNAKIELLQLQGKTHSDKVAMHTKALENLNVLAPNDGIFVYEKNWRGEKVRAGQSLWSGSKIGSIPDLSKMQAKLYVLETQASGLLIGQVVNINLDAYPDKNIVGKVAKIASIATPKQRNNPVKYFEIIVDIAITDSTIMKPGQKLSAKIVVANHQSTLSVPNQALYQKDGIYWLYVADGGQFERRDVIVGQRSLTKSQILSGINNGDRIALTKPEEVDPS
ncbi:MAG: efflux RND transporter periplasmic adaptor subunit [Psychrobium sp.]|nr:efflux RND transporter periplasmic adaptor subunit [Psychrobium sp.]